MAERTLLDAAEIEKILDTMAGVIARGRRTGVPLRLVGVRSRGVPLAQRLATRLEKMLGEQVAVGALEITLYRDDLNQSQRWPILNGTEIPFSVDGAEVVLVDDVLFTGRTVRAALNAICDLGRPSLIRLAVLIDRGHRELPVRADVVGHVVASRGTDRVHVRIQPIDPVDEVVIVSGD